MGFNLGLSATQQVALGEAQAQGNPLGGARAYAVVETR
jgi:hypothetical protein